MIRFFNSYCKDFCFKIFKTINETVGPWIVIFVDTVFSCREFIGARYKSSAWTKYPEYWVRGRPMQFVDQKKMNNS